MNYIEIKFPNKTAKQIVESCDNKLGTGKLLYNTDWYKGQDFFTKEKCRPRTVWVSKELIGLGKNFNECKDLVKEEKGEMLNFAETVFFLQEYFRQTGEYPWNYNYSWTSSLSSDGILVHVGRAGSDGVGVDGGYPGYSDSDRGVCFSRSVLPKGAKPEQGKADSIVSLPDELIINDIKYKKI